MATLPLRAGLSGCGGISRWTMEAAKHSRFFRVTALQDADPGILDAFGSEWGIPRRHSRYSDLVADDVDFLILNTPNHLHLEQMEAAAWAKMPSLVQKPVARTLSEAERMLAVSRSASVKVGACMMELASPLNHQVRAMIQDGVIGKPCLVQAMNAHDFYLKAPPPEDNWRRDPAKVGGAAFIQLAVHHLNLASWLLGQGLRKVAALSTSGNTVFAKDETTVASALFADGTAATFTASYATSGSQFAVHGTEGYIRMFDGNLALKGARPFRGRVFDYLEPGREAVHTAEELKPRAEKDAERCEVHGWFARWVAGDEAYPVPLEAALRDMRVLDAVYRSVEEGKAIEV